MSKLHQILDQRNSDLGYRVSTLGGNDSSIGLFVEALDKCIGSSICFDVGEYSKDRMLFNDCNVKIDLPFDTCCFELFDDDISLCVVINKKTEDLYCFWLFCKNRESGWNLIKMFSAESIFSWTIHSPYELGEVETTSCISILRSICWFLVAMSCKNVSKKQIKPDEKLNTARSKRGKVPIFSTWVLELNGVADRGESKGGTHAAPRVHLRRGHPRQYLPGLWTWVQPSVVGTIKSGIVQKEYRAGNRLSAVSVCA